MKAIELYKHLVSTNYSNIKTKSDDFRKIKKQKNKTRKRS